MKEGRGEGREEERQGGSRKVGRKGNYTRTFLFHSPYGTCHETDSSRLPWDLVQGRSHLCWIHVRAERLQWAPRQKQFREPKFSIHPQPQVLATRILFNYLWVLRIIKCAASQLEVSLFPPLERTGLLQQLSLFNTGLERRKSTMTGLKWNPKPNKIHN